MILIHKVLLAIPMVLSTFIHIWNPTGFPTFHNDEGEYVARAIYITNGLGVQESSFYDHPYFGVLLLSSLFSILDYPDSLIPTSERIDAADSVPMLYLIPRAFMGLIAVVDTFLVYKIAERRYDRTAAFIASMLFAVMPFTWILRRILLDSIMLPFLLSSIFFAIHINNNKTKSKNQICHKETKSRKYLLVLLSSTFLGLAIFSKIPAFTFIPMVGVLVFRNSDIKILSLWIIPVIVIPSLWPGYAWANDEFDDWSSGVLLQTQRLSQPLIHSLYNFFKTDPVLFIMGIGGLMYAAIRRDHFLLLWTLPFLLFLYYIGYVKLFHMIPVLPIFCISIAVIIRDLLGIIVNRSILRVLWFAIVFGLTIFGFLTTFLLVRTELNDSNFQVATFVIKHISETADRNESKDLDRITVIADPFYYWIPKYVIDHGFIFMGYENKTPIITDRVLLVVDWGFKVAMSRNDNHSRQLQKLVNATTYLTSSDFVGHRYDYSKYPYDILERRIIESQIEIRTNYK